MQKVILKHMNLVNIDDSIEVHAAFNIIKKKYNKLTAEQFRNICNNKQLKQLLEKGETILTIKFNNKIVYLTFEF